MKDIQFCSNSRKAIILSAPEEYASHSTGQARKLGKKGGFSKVSKCVDRKIQYK